jgi:hypothetical protein
MSRITSFVFITLPLTILFSPILVPLLLLHIITGGAIWQVVEPQGGNAAGFPDCGPAVVHCDDDLFHQEDSVVDSRPMFNIDGTMMVNDTYDVHGNAYGFVGDAGH